MFISGILGYTELSFTCQTKTEILCKIMMQNIICDAYYEETKTEKVLLFSFLRYYCNWLDYSCKIVDSSGTFSTGACRLSISVKILMPDVHNFKI